jgi:hypothetical protein
MKHFKLPGLPVALLALCLNVSADDKKVDDKKGHDEHGGAFMECAKACDDCARSCDACGAHCAKLLADGKKEHLKTLATCQDCATMCSAASCIVARHGPFSHTICTACADACKQCGDACDKFKNDDMMKRCADECRKCEKACRAMLKHISAETK